MQEVPYSKYIVACQAHPALVKIGLVLARLFHFCSLLVRIHFVKVLRMPSPPVYELKGERTVSHRGSEIWRLYGDPAPLAHDNKALNIITFLT